MVVYSNAAEQVVSPGQSLTLTKLSYCNCDRRKDCYANTIPGATVSGKGPFVAAFTGNVSSATAAVPIELSIAVDGVPIPTSRMVTTPAAADALENISAVTGFSGNSCCMSINVTVENTGTNPITVAPNAGLVIWTAYEHRFCG